MINADSLVDKDVDFEYKIDSLHPLFLIKLEIDSFSFLLKNDLIKDFIVIFIYFLLNEFNP